MPTGLSIRTATSEDAAALAELARRTFHDTFAADNEPADMQAYLDSALSRSRLDAELADPQNVFLLAHGEDSRAPLGYAKLRLDSPLPVPGADGTALELSRLYVDRPALGRGVGAALMRTILGLARARHYPTVWLGVWEHNLRAQQFYARWGMRVVGRQPFMLGTDLQSDLLMSVRTF